MEQEQIRALLIPPVAGEPEVVSIPAEDTAQLAALEHHVGGLLEAVMMPPGRVMWVNEEGKLNQMPANGWATVVARGHIKSSEVIAGPAIVTGSDGCDIAPLTDRQLADLLAVMGRTLP